MMHRDFDDWMDALSRKNPDGTPAVAWKARCNAAFRLAPYAFDDVAVLNRVEQTALNDPDFRVRERAQDALGDEARRRLNAKRPDVRLKMLGALAALPQECCRAASRRRRAG